MQKLTEEFLKLINLKKPLWTPSLNFFSDILLSELSKLAGYIPGESTLTVEDREYIAKENYTKRVRDKVKLPTDYPNKFSWLNVKGKDFMTPVKNQGFCSSCSAFGSLAVVESMAKIYNNKDINLSEAQLFFKSPGFSSKNSNDTHNCRTGWTVEDALNYLTNTGVIPESMFPYDTEDKTADLPLNWGEHVTKISGYTKLTNTDDIKRWLSSKGPLIGAMSVKTDFIFYGKGIYSPILGSNIGSHCITIVGYNEDYQAWLCKNSWSEHWGENGYFWIKYGECGVGSEMWGINKVILRE